MNQSPRILVIRRDNIGDLLCTTPMLHALRVRYPKGYIAALVSDYNAAVLDRNPDLDDVFVFIKRQHRTQGLWKTLWQRWSLIKTLRARKFDYVILANGGLRYGKKLGGTKTIGFRERDNSDLNQPDILVALENRGRNEHEVEKMSKLSAVLDVQEPLNDMRLFPDPLLASDICLRLQALGWQEKGLTIAVHISSRQAIQRWPEASFLDLIKSLTQSYGYQVLLFWAPGSETNPAHPGDDEKAARLMAALQGQPIFACPTSTIPELAATLSLAQQMICSDGGAMHVAAALGLPILCFFGHSNAVEWHPWQVPYVLLQPETKRVADISVESALQGFDDLQQKLASLPST